MFWRMRIVAIETCCETICDLIANEFGGVQLEFLRAARARVGKRGNHQTNKTNSSGVIWS